MKFMNPRKPGEVDLAKLVKAKKWQNNQIEKWQCELSQFGKMHNMCFILSDLKMFLGALPQALEIIFKMQS